MAEMGVKVQKFTPTVCEFTFFGVEFNFNPLIPVVGGFCIAALASFLGVGGGFLLVPFLTSVAGLPMYPGCRYLRPGGPHRHGQLPSLPTCCSSRPRSPGA